MVRQIINIVEEMNIPCRSSNFYFDPLNPETYQKGLNVFSGVEALGPTQSELYNLEQLQTQPKVILELTLLIIFLLIIFLAQLILLKKKISLSL